MQERSLTRCGPCGLNQFRTATNKCRRCKQDLATGSIASTIVVYIPFPVPVAVPVAAFPGGQGAEAVMTLRKVIQAAAVHAVAFIPQTTKAAAALGISHFRLKQLLREAGDNVDRRTDRPKKK